MGGGEGCPSGEARGMGYIVIILSKLLGGNCRPPETTSMLLTNSCDIGHVHTVSFFLGGGGMGYNY